MLIFVEIVFTNVISLIYEFSPLSFLMYNIYALGNSKKIILQKAILGIILFGIPRFELEPLLTLLTLNFYHQRYLAQMECLTLLFLF